VKTKSITFDGMVEDRTIGCPVINIGYNFNDRTLAPEDGHPVVATVKHGERGLLLKRKGDGCKVKTRSGVEGWVKYWWIKELK